VVAQEVTQAGQALRHPGPAVEQVTGLQQRPDVDGRGGAEPAGPVRERLLLAGVAEEVQIRGYAQTQRPGIAHGVRTDPAPRIVVLRPARHPQHRRGGRDIRREDRDAVQGTAGRHHPDRAEQAPGRFDADDAVERGRHPAGSGGVGAEREVDKPGGDRDRRAGTRAAGDQAATEDALRGPVRRAGAGEAGGELVQVGLADQRGARVEQAAHHRRRAVRPVREVRTGGGGRQAGDVDVVLDRERETGQRPAGGRRGGLLMEPVRGDRADPDAVVAPLLPPLEIPVNAHIVDCRPFHFGGRRLV
jgi:hypothetical protein